MKRIKMKTSKVRQAGGGRDYYDGGHEYMVRDHVADELVDEGVAELADGKISKPAAAPKPDKAATKLAASLKPKKKFPAKKPVKKKKTS